MIFQGSRGGPTFLRGGGSNFLQRGGGGWSNCVFPIEIHITCDIPPVPPLDPRILCVGFVFGPASVMWFHVSLLVQHSSRRGNEKSWFLYVLLTLYSLAFISVALHVCVLKFLHLGAMS